MGRNRLIQNSRLISSREEMLSFAKELLPSLSKGTILALSGPLGAGKTTFVQGLAKALQIEEEVQSPTFSLMQTYPKLTHFDLYRLKTAEDFLSLGFDEYLDQDQICAIEWPEKIASFLPKTAIWLSFEYQGEKRIVSQRLK